MYSEFLRTIARWAIQMVVAFAIGVAILSVMHKLADYAKGDLRPEIAVPVNMYPPRDEMAPKIRFIHSDGFRSDSAYIVLKDLYLFSGNWYTQHIYVRNTSHFYWHPLDREDNQYILVNAIKNPRGFYEIDSIEDYSGDKIKPISLRKPEDMETYDE